MNIQIAEVLNVSPNQIKSVREMAWVYCVVVVGQRATFVSKKKVEAKKMVEIKCSVANDTIRFISDVAYTLNNVSLIIKYQGEIGADSIPWCISQGMTAAQVDKLAADATAAWLGAPAPTSAVKSAAQAGYESDMAKIDEMEDRLYSANCHH
jgi:hypothetical protein